MGFEKFTHVKSRYSPSASINAQGVIGMSQGAKNRFGINGEGYAVLYYDRQEQLIGIEIVADGNTEGALSIKDTGTGAYIKAKSFVQYYAIALDGTRHGPLEKDPVTGFLIFDLKKAKVRNSKQRIEPTSE